MARKGLKIANPNHEADQRETWDEDGTTYVVKPTEDSELDDVFSDFPQNEACIELYRIHKQGGRPVFLEQMTPSNFTMAYVTEHFGGGRFIAKAKYSNGNRKRMPFEIEGDPIPVRRHIVNLNTGRELPISGAVNPHDSLNRAVFAEPIANQIVMPGSTPQPTTDTNAAILQLVKQMVSELKGSEMQILEKMRLYKELFSGGEKREAPLDTAINMLTRGIELGQAGGDGGGIPWLALIREMKDPLTKLADTIHSAVARPRVIMPSQPGSPAQPEQPNPEPHTSMEQPDMLTSMLKMVLPPLINGARRNADPTAYVDFLLDQFPDSAYPMLLSFLQAPDCLDKLATIEPGILYQAEWWKELRESLLKALAEDTQNDRTVQPSPYSDSPTGNQTDS